jgi:hypothetical protein
LNRQDWLRQPLKGRVERILYGIPEPTPEGIVDDALARTVRCLEEQVSTEYTREQFDKELAVIEAELKAEEQHRKGGC